jgi:hypothetical protein
MRNGDPAIGQLGDLAIRKIVGARMGFPNRPVAESQIFPIAKLPNCRIAKSPMVK